jgi:flagellar P-ring protein precursor FlgI
MKRIAALLIAAACLAPGARVKELVSIEGVRENQLVGYGLVVGLAGTGDRRQTVFSVQTLTNMLERMGVSVPPAAIRVNNTAAVMLTATLPPYAQSGTRLDVTAAAVGDAASLQGGLLIMTPLRGANGAVYAVAQGPVVTGGFVAGRAGNSQTVNHPTVGRVPNGAIVERPAPSVPVGNRLRLQLHQADFTTAARVAAALNKKFAPGADPVAKPENAALVSVAVPPPFASRAIDFIAELEAVTVEADRPAKVVVNERTGTIVMGNPVRIAPAAIMHGNLAVEIQTAFEVSQPAPMSSGNTELVPKVGVGVRQEPARNIVLKNGATVEELVRALAAIGSTPRDIVAILQSLRAAGALDAELEVI